ncbi:MraY family glycosyltransferase [Streptomyces sp. NPDC006552]|uniref:MraY family glycosyltransferase n=1 Tax=Streptomyces sp. NPDC006552 TaxID=3157179 RepID=UPI0033A4977A
MSGPPGPGLTMLYGTAAAATALLLSLSLTAALRLAAPGDRRRGARPARTRAVPRLGGAAVAGTLAVVLGAGIATGRVAPDTAAGPLLLAAGAVALLGFLDDLRPRGVRARVVVQAAAASVVVHGTQLGLVAGAAAVLWIVFVTNAFALLDAFDGALGVVGTVTALGLCVCAGAQRAGSLAVVLGLLAASLTGFLAHNWYPARIRAGSCGALLTGFLLAGAALILTTGPATAATPAALFALTVVVSTDAALVVLARRLAGRGVLRRGPDHLGHRLRRLGLTPPGVAVVLGAASALGTATGVLLHRGTVGAPAAWWLAGAALVSVALLVRVPVPAGRGRPRAARAQAAELMRAEL